MSNLETKFYFIRQKLAWKVVLPCFDNLSRVHANHGYDTSDRGGVEVQCGAFSRAISIFYYYVRFNLLIAKKHTENLVVQCFSDFSRKYIPIHQNRNNNTMIQWSSEFRGSILKKIGELSESKPCIFRKLKTSTLSRHQ